MLSKEIIFLLPSIKSGGGNRVVIELSNVLVSLGYSVRIIFPNNSLDVCTYYIDPLIALEAVGTHSSSRFTKINNLLKVFFRVNSRVKDNSNAVVVITDPIMSIFSPVLRASKLFRFIQADDYKIFDDLHILKNSFVLNAYKFLTKISYRFYNIRYIFNSRYTYDCFLESSGRTDVHYSLVYPAINHDVFTNSGIRHLPRKANIGIVARKHPWKGFRDFVDAVKRLDKSSYGDVYVISHDDLASFDLSGFTIIQPHSDQEIASVLCNCDIFISTSWWEGFGLPPLEAMSCGCALILSNSGGVNEYAQVGVNCLMYQPKDVNQLTSQMQLLLNSPSEIVRFSNNGLSASKEFSWANSAKQFIDIISA